VPVRGIRGATTATVNTAEEITDATEELLKELTRLNKLDTDEICFAYFTTTHDLTAEFPAYAARRMGWLEVPLLCGHDMDVQLPNPRGVDVHPYPSALQHCRASIRDALRIPARSAGDQSRPRVAERNVHPVIIVMTHTATDADIKAVVDRVHEIGLKTELSRGEERTLVGSSAAMPTPTRRRSRISTASTRSSRSPSPSSWRAASSGPSTLWSMWRDQDRR